MTQVPLWVAIVIAAGAPVLAFAGALVGQWLGRKSDREVEVRWRREETMRMLRWAAEMSASSEQSRVVLGVAALAALGRSPLLQEDDQALISAVFAAVAQPAAARYHRGEQVEER